MGVEQFYSPIKTSVETIEHMTENIELSTMTIESLVNTIKNTDLGQLEYKIDNIKSTNQGTVYKNTLSQIYDYSTHWLKMDISGAGWLIGMYSPYSQDIGIVIDNIPITGYGGSKSSNNMYTTVKVPTSSIFVPLLMRFNNRLIVKSSYSDVTQLNVLYVLD